MGMDFRPYYFFFQVNKINHFNWCTYMNDVMGIRQERNILGKLKGVKAGENEEVLHILKCAL